MFLFHCPCWRISHINSILLIQDLWCCLSLTLNSACLFFTTWLRDWNHNYQVTRFENELQNKSRAKIEFTCIKKRVSIGKLERSLMKNRRSHRKKNYLWTSQRYYSTEIYRCHLLNKFFIGRIDSLKGKSPSYVKNYILWKPSEMFPTY